MSTAYFIVLDRKVRGFDPSVNGKALAHESKRLDKVAKELGLRALDDFVSYSPEEFREMMEGLGADEDEVAGMTVPEQQWFAPKEGLAWVAKVTANVRANPAAVKDAKAVLADLDQFREVLEQAKAARVRWNLQIDI